MLKLCTTLVLGAFLIYGLDDLGVITTDDFEMIEQASAQQSQVEPTPKATGKFTDRIVQKRQEMKEAL